MGQRKKQRISRTYTEEFIQSAVQLALQSSSPLDTIAKELGIPSPTLYTWISKFKKGKTSLTNLKQKKTIPADNPTIEKLQSNIVSLMEENRSLNKTIAALSEEKSILKKAAAYFAKELK